MPTGDIVGREEELTRIDSVLSAVGRGEFRALVLHGPAGIGKTRLLSELVHRAASLGALVCCGNATEFERLVPFAVFRDAFAGVAGTEALVDDPSPGIDRYRLFHQVRRVLSEIPAVRPTVLVLDDLHWADQASAELTAFLLRRPVAGGLLIAAAYRPAPAPAGVADAALHLGPAATVIGLGPLTPADVTALMPAEPAHRRGMLYQSSGGNPLYLQALASCTDAALARLAGTDDDPRAPEAALLDVFSAELHGLDADLRHIAKAAAVAGDPAALDLVAWIAERPETEVAAAVDDLDRLGVLTTAVDSRLRFRHPLVRTAAYWKAGAGWRTRAHERAAEFLRARHGPLQILAHHTERSARNGDETAADTLADAGTATLHTAPATAARLLRAGLRIMPQVPDRAGRRIDLQMKLARALGVTGQLDESRSLLQEVMHTGGHRRVEAVTFASVVYRLLGRFDEARAMLAGELDRSFDDSRAFAHALVELIAVELARNDPATACRYAERAVRITTATGDMALEAAACALRALGDLHLGRTADAQRWAHRAAWLVDGAGDTVLLPYIELLAPLAWVEWNLQRYEAARRHVDRGLALANRHGRSHSIPYLLITAACVHIRCGRPAAALTLAGEAEELSALINGVETAAMAAAVALKPVLWRDGPRAAVALARQIAHVRRPRSAWWSETVTLDLAEVYLAAEEPQRCLAELADGAGAGNTVASDGGVTDRAAVGTGRAATGGRAETAAYRWALHAVASAEFGRLEQARAMADRALGHAREIGLSHQIAAAHEARARVLARIGSVDDEAIRAAGAAVTGYADAGTPVEEGCVRHLVAQLHARAGRPGPARTELDRAKSLFTACDVGWLATCLARTERRLAAMGPRRRGPVGTGIEVLTGREREVASLAGAGLTNREIAERLVLSQKTVEAHVSRILTKLGVRSRVALARQLAGP